MKLVLKNYIYEEIRTLQSLLEEEFEDRSNIDDGKVMCCLEEMLHILVRRNSWEEQEM